MCFARQPYPQRGIPTTRISIAEVATGPTTVSRNPSSRQTLNSRQSHRKEVTPDSDWRPRTLDPSPSVSLAERLNLLRIPYTRRSEQTSSSDCSHLAAAQQLDTGSGTAVSPCSGRTAIADRTLIFAAQVPRCGGLRRSHQPDCGPLRSPLPFPHVAASRVSRPREQTLVELRLSPTPQTGVSCPMPDPGRSASGAGVKAASTTAAPSTSPH